MLNGHIDPTLSLHLFTKIQPTATATSQVNAKYVPGTNMHIQLAIHVT